MNESERKERERVNERKAVNGGEGSNVGKERKGVNVREG